MVAPPTTTAKYWPLIPHHNVFDQDKIVHMNEALIWHEFGSNPAHTRTSNRSANFQKKETISPHVFKLLITTRTGQPQPQPITLQQLFTSQWSCQYAPSYLMNDENAENDNITLFLAHQLPHNSSNPHQSWPPHMMGYIHTDTKFPILQFALASFRDHC